MKNLDEIGLNNKSDKSSNYHNYLDLYDKYFSKYRESNITLLEIGILNGDSLNIFNEYFKNINITAIDIEDKSHLKNVNIDIIKGDQSDRSLLKNLNDNYDIIIDDGSHKMPHQQISFGVLFPKLKNGGIYIIEDLHTSFNEYRENIIYGKELFDLTDDNRTIDFLNGIINNEPINKYLMYDEYQYLINNVKSIDIIETNRISENEFSITSIIIKK